MTTTAHPLADEVLGHLADTLAELDPAPAATAGPITDTEALAGEIFDLLTSREFCYLSRKRTAPYREQTVGLLRHRMATGEPFRFFYDIGPGYHASIRPGELDLRFHMGLSELLILAQIAKLCRRVRELYAPGARFWLVIDNLCALRTNDIPVELTEGYAACLRDLIQETGLVDRVELMVESESFSLAEYDRVLETIESQPLPSPPAPDAVANVERFLGRPCSLEEASERIERYRRATVVTDALIDRLVQGVHMTQRATGATLGFRPFPGGDARTQCGEVMLGRNRKGRLRPFLVTNRNAHAYSFSSFVLPGILPQSIREVAFAEPRDS